MRIVIKTLIILSLPCLLIISSCKKDPTPPPTKTCDEEMAEIDPVYIYSALYYMYDLEDDTTNPERDSIILLKSGIEERYNLLNAIRNSKTPQSDSIFNIFKAVHADYYYLQYINFTLPGKELYYSDNELQKIIKKYNLTLVSTDEFNPPYTSFILKACPIINTYKLIREIEAKTTIPYVRWDVLPDNIKPFHRWGFSRQKFEVIEDPTDKSKFVKIYIGWGDCPSGCLKNHTWEFRVYEDLSVKHLRSYGRIP